MRPNLTPVERDLRLAFGVPGAILVVFSFGITSVVGILALVAGVMMAISAITGYSPFIDLLGDQEPDPLTR